MADETVTRVLTEGAMEIHGRIAGSSNATLLVTCRLGNDELRAVYKPIKGERPLWDFPGGLFRRAVQVGRRVRAQTAIARGTTSLSHVAVQVAAKATLRQPVPCIRSPKKRNNRF